MTAIPVIAQGSANARAVKNWQGLLVAAGYDLGISGTRGDGIDGVFGAATTAATKDLQATAKITVDGTVGPQTWTSALTA